MTSSAHLSAMEGHLPCLKYLVSVGASPEGVLGARNDQGETPRNLAQQFYKENIMTYIDGIEYERDHPEQQESKLCFLSCLSCLIWRDLHFVSACTCCRYWRSSKSRKFFTQIDWRNMLIQRQICVWLTSVKDGGSKLIIWRIFQDSYSFNFEKFVCMFVSGGWVGGDNVWWTTVIHVEDCNGDKINKSQQRI